MERQDQIVFSNWISSSTIYDETKIKITFYFDTIWDVVVKNNFYVNYGNEQTGILYGEVWLGSRAFIVQSCGENCAMWCDVDERRMYSAYF